MPYDPEKPLQPDGMIVTKSWLFDWDVWILKLFKRRRTSNVDCPQTIEDCEESKIFDNKQ
jgi:hypothetical protein